MSIVGVEVRVREYGVFANPHFILKVGLGVAASAPIHLIPGGMNVGFTPISVYRSFDA